MFHSLQLWVSIKHFFVHLKRLNIAFFPFFPPELFFKEVFVFLTWTLTAHLLADVDFLMLKNGSHSLVFSIK